jgi:hypothetical protein
MNSDNLFFRIVQITKRNKNNFSESFSGAPPLRENTVHLQPPRLLPHLSHNAPGKTLAAVFDALVSAH